MTHLFQPDEYINKRAFEKLDLLLLAIESLDNSASQEIMTAIKKLKLHKYFPNKVEVWKYRCHNPMRKTYRHVNQSRESIEPLISLLAYMAELFYPKIRQLLSTKDPHHVNEERWNEFNVRFNDLVQERLNIKRSIVRHFLYSNKENRFRELVLTLALSSGEGGKKRLLASLLDPVI